MPDWSKSMQQTYEYWTVDPKTLKDKARLTNVTGCTIERDEEVDTLGSATVDFTEMVGEEYIRAYLVTNQNGVKERHPLGTVLIQTPSSDFNGMIRTISADAYTPLIELKEKMPPIGYSVPKDREIMATVSDLTADNVQVPVITTTNSDYKLKSDFVADPSETWLAFLKSMLENTNYGYSLDSEGRIGFTPKRDVEAMQPTWTYDDGNSSILYADVSIKHDLFDVPNAVEVVYSGESGSMRSYVENHDPDSPVSIERRGRIVSYRDTNPSIPGSSEDENGVPTQAYLDSYAEQLLKELSTVEYTISYTHAYCGTKLGDCVRLNYERAGIENIKAKIISQSIKCTPGCPVSEKAVFKTKLWG